MKVLVVGGAGYIGSHMVKRLLRCGHDAVTFDDLSSGHRDAVLGGGFERASLADRSALDTVFRKYRFDAVMHFASFIQVGESVAKPATYYRNNYVAMLPRREGDAAQLVSDSRKAREILGWNPAHGRLEEVIENAWRWAQRATNHVI